MAIVPLAKEETLGRYRLAARLGRGGMAELFLGRLIGAGGFEKLVAIKRMLPHLSEDPQFVAMFENEGRITAALNHPNLCEVYELGESDGQLFLAMEFLRGLPWSEIVAALPDEPQAPFLRFVVGMILQACEGLHHAHTATDESGRPRHVVHRDVSPSNLMITTDGIVKLLDFGVSKVLTERKRTQTGMLKGKLAYMAPEQIKNLPLDARSDIFSLGVIAWEAIAGRALFDRPSDYDMFKAVIEDEIPHLPGSSGNAIYSELDTVIRRALSRDREARQNSARAFADELRRAIAPLGEPMPAAEMSAHFAAWLGPSIARRNREIAELLAQLRGEVTADERPTDFAPSGASAELTRVRVQTPSVPGVRLRDRSIVVGSGLRDSAARVPDTIDPVLPAPVESWNDPIVPSRPAPGRDADTLDRVIAGIAPPKPEDVDTIDLVSGNQQTAPRVTMSDEKTVVSRPRTPSGARTPVPRPMETETEGKISSVAPTGRRSVPRVPPQGPMPPMPSPLAPVEDSQPGWHSWLPVVVIALVAIAIGVAIAIAGA